MIVADKTDCLVSQLDSIFLQDIVGVSAVTVDAPFCIDAQYVLNTDIAVSSVILETVDIALYTCTGAIDSLCITVQS